MPEENLKTHHRLYADLAWLWPLWGSPAEYGPYCRNITRLIHQYAQREVQTLLNLCCGGGKNVYNLKAFFSVSGLDLSADMLKLARELNPECRFFQADMRTFAIPETFDAILIDDGIMYMTSESDLLSVFERAFEHLRPGGVMVVGPDATKETFIQNRTEFTQANPENLPKNLEVVFIENNYDPVPKDTTFEGLMIYLIRENGILRIEQDYHLLGLFPQATWENLLEIAGFEVHREIYQEDGERFTEFVCVKPGA
jgi:SAM-dependent methyltransferase